MEAWLDGRDREQLLAQIGELAKSYTPEWQFSAKSPDAGSAIAMIFANQTADTVKKMNLLLDKYRTELVNMYGVCVRPAMPASTAAVMTLSESRRNGTTLEKGMHVAGENDEGKEILYELQSDLYVAAARIKTAFLATGRDNIIIPYNENLPLFDYSHGRHKRQALRLHFKCLYWENGIHIKFTGGRLASAQDTAALFADPGAFGFYYGTDGSAGDIAAFESVLCEGDTLALRQCSGKKADPDGMPSAGMIIIEAKKALAEDICLSGIDMMMEGRSLKPDFVVTDTAELDKESFLPFGRQLSLYQSCYIGQGCLFGQAGAKAELRFSLSFGSFSTERAQPPDTDLSIIKRRKRAAYSVPAPKCMVQETALEYFNGRGWKRLDCGRDVSGLFADPQKAGEVRICFEVPPDWEDTRQCGYEQNVLRFQAIRAENCYLQEVEYCYPVITDMVFGLHSFGGIKPVKAERVTDGNTQDITAQLLRGNAVNCFSKNPYDGDFFFIGLDAKPGQGAVSVFFELQERMLHKDAQLSFAYSAPGGFCELEAVDRTDRLQHSGIITFVLPPDMESRTLEGTDAYWIRIEDMQKSLSADAGRCPVLKKMYMNAVEVTNYEWKDEQNYYIDMVSQNMRFPLYCGNIISAEVWVNEINMLSDAEMEALKKAGGGRVRAEYNLAGRVEEFYVLWKEAESFDRAGAGNRIYCIDRHTNEILFGNGINTRIPNNTSGIAFKARVLACSGAGGNVGQGAINRFHENIFTIDGLTNPAAAYGGADMESRQDALLRGSLILGARKRLVTERDYEREACAFSDSVDKASCLAGISRDEAGAVSLVLLMKDYQKGSYSFRAIRDRLKNHIVSACEMTGVKKDLSIVEPIFVRIFVKVWCEVPDVEIPAIQEIRKEILSGIEAYLEPTGAHGWQIGQLPTEEQLHMLLGTFEQLAHIRAWSFSAAYTDSMGRHEAGVDDIRATKNPFVVCCNGEHTVYICGNRP